MKTRLQVLPLAVAAALLAPAQAALAADDDLENIVVTAQSRAQSQRDVPIAMQVITVQQIEDLGAVNLSDLNGYLPGLVVDGSQPTQPNFSLRGIGTGDFGIGTDAAVGVYVDGIYTGKTGGSLLNFNDMQRVEVLKGPQGTLFGRNTAAGAIAIVTNEPGRGTDASALVRYGRFNTLELNGMVNVPVSDTEALRFSAVSRNSDGWLTNTSTGQKVGGDGNWGTRLAYKWAPSSDVKFVATWEHEVLQQPARPIFSLVNAPVGTTPAVPPNPASFVNPLDIPLQNDAPSEESRTFDGLALRYERTLGGVHFTSNSALRHFTTFNSEDNDGTANPATYINTINAEGNTSFQQEFKLAAGNALLDWVAGASYYHVDARQVSTVNTTSDTVNTLLANTQGLPILLAFDQALAQPGFGFGFPWQEKMINANRTTSYSLYGDAIWHVASATNLTTGLRWTLDRKDVSWYTPPYFAPGLDALFAGTTQPFGSTFGTAAGTLIGALTGTTAPPITNVAFSSAAQVAAAPVSAARSWGDISPRLVLDHHFDTDTMAFASVTRGFQSGGYDVFSPLASFEPEHMVNYEVGVKRALPSVRGSVEASVFHYQFSNLQNITLVTVHNALPVYDVRTSDQSATGVDASGRVEVARDASVFGAVEYLRQQYNHYQFTDNLSGATDSLDGQPVGTPLLTLALGGRASWAVGSGKAEFLLQGTHLSATRCNKEITQNFGCLNTGAIQTGTAQTKIDSRLGWSGDHFGMAVLVNNLFNKQYVSGGAGESGYTLGTPNGTVSPPRFIGVEFSASL